jgi:hypothetical protein
VDGYRFAGSDHAACVEGDSGNFRNRYGSRGVLGHTTGGSRSAKCSLVFLCVFVFAIVIAFRRVGCIICVVVDVVVVVTAAGVVAVVAATAGGGPRRRTAVVVVVVAIVVLVAVVVVVVVVIAVPLLLMSPCICTGALIRFRARHEMVSSMQV